MKFILPLTTFLAFGGLLHAEKADGSKCNKEQACEKSACKKSKCSGKTLSLKVTGLDDAATSEKAHAAISKIAGAKVCTACSGSGSFAIKYDPAKVKEAALRTAVTDSGLKITGQKIAFKVSGMTCGGCAGLLSRNIARIDGVKEVGKVCAKSNHAEITIDPAVTDAKKISTAISATKFKLEEASLAPAAPAAAPQS